MPVGRGIMQIGRINIYPTTTVLLDVEPSPVTCGQSVNFGVTVTNNRLTAPTPTGNVIIMDTNSGTVLATHSLSPTEYTYISEATMNIVFTINGNVNLVAFYEGVTNIFIASNSDLNHHYDINYMETTLDIIGPPAFTSFCYHDDQPITAQVIPVSGSFIPTGYVQFILWKNGSDFIDLGTAPLVSGVAIGYIPSGTTISGQTYYIQILYTGQGCFGASHTPSGTSGTLVHSASNTTTMVLAEISNTPFCIHQPVTLYATVSSSVLSPPNIGLVTWHAVKDSFNIELGTSGVVAGAASFEIEGDVLPVIGGWELIANYSTDGFCYNNSTSTPLNIVASEFNVTVVVESGSTNFCLSDAETFSVHLSSATVGTIIGTVTLKTQGGTQELVTVPVFGSNTGFSVDCDVPSSVFSTGSQNITATFNSDGNDCFGSNTSANYPVTVQSYFTQTPNDVDLIITPAFGFPSTTFTFQIEVNKGSNVGPLDGAGFLNGSATLYFYPPDGSGPIVLDNDIHITDFGSYGMGIFTLSGFPVGTNGFIAKWNGNLCYNTLNSPTKNVEINP